MKTSFTKTPKNGGMLHNVRVNFPQLDAPKAFDEDETKAKYSIELLVPKADKVAVKALTDYINNIIQKADLKPIQRSAVKKKALDNADAGNDYATLKDGDLMNQKRLEEEKDKREEYVGQYVIRLKKNPAHGKPLVVDASAQEIPAMRIKEEILAGYYCNVAFSGYVYKFNGKPGFSMSLNAVQKVAEAEVFGQVNPFEALEGAETEEEELNDNPFAS